MSQAWPSVSLYPCNQQELSRNCTRTQRPRKIRSVANLKAQTNSKPTWDQQNNSIIHTPCHQSELPSNIASLQGRSSRTISASSFLWRLLEFLWTSLSPVPSCTSFLSARAGLSAPVHAGLGLSPDGSQPVMCDLGGRCLGRPCWSFLGWHMLTSRHERSNAQIRVWYIYIILYIIYLCIYLFIHSFIYFFIDYLFIYYLYIYLIYLFSCSIDLFI